MRSDPERAILRPVMALFPVIATGANAGDRPAFEHFGQVRLMQVLPYQPLLAAPSHVVPFVSHSAWRAA